MTADAAPADLTGLPLADLAARLLAAERARDRAGVGDVDAELRRRAAEAGEYGLLDGEDDGSVRAAFLRCYRELLGVA